MGFALSRRRALGWLPLLLAQPMLAGCGFKLRETPPMPFARIALNGFAARSPLEIELRTRLAESAQVVNTPAQAAQRVKFFVQSDTVRFERALPNIRGTTAQ